jgi:hypothetical protein
VAGVQRVGVLTSEDPLVVGDQGLSDRRRLLDAPGVEVGMDEVAAADERGVVLGSKDPLTVPQHGLEDRD